MKFTLSAFAFLFAASSTSLLVAEENWNQFRGPTGRGHSTAADVPTEWTADSVKWRVELKGTGQSSPVNWADKLFLTSASGDGKERFIFCIDRKTGKTIWEKSVPCANPESAHKMNSRATPTCTVDADSVIAFFGPGGLHCFDHDGNPKWSKDLGAFPGNWGVAASPMIVGDNVIQNTDSEGESQLIAFNTKTGDPAWATKRETKPKGGWSTPVLIETGGKIQLVLNGEFGVRGYDPENGKELWFCKGFNGRGAPVPDFDGETVFVVNGKPGDVYAVKPDGSGDVTASHMVWHKKRKAGRDLPSPAAVDGFVVVVDMGGVGACFDAKTGAILWNDRIGLKGECAASPLVANGNVYFQNVFGGEVYVIKPGKEMNVVSVNPLGAASDEIFRATLAPIQGDLFARSQTALYCIGK